MKSKWVRVISVVFLLVTIGLVVEYMDIKSQLVDYDLDTIKKAAYDDLDENLQAKVVASLEDFHTYGMTAQKKADIWLYASCEEIKLKTLGKHILWNSEAIKEDYDIFTNRNKIIIKVTMETWELFMEKIIVYVDPSNNTVIGYGITF